MANKPEDGMTMRDWFAGKVLNGVMSEREMFLAIIRDAPPETEPSEFISQEVYRIADAMLAERKKR